MDIRIYKYKLRAPYGGESSDPWYRIDLTRDKRSIQEYIEDNHPLSNVMDFEWEKELINPKQYLTNRLSAEKERLKYILDEIILLERELVKCG